MTWLYLSPWAKNFFKKPLFWTSKDFEKTNEIVESMQAMKAAIEERIDGAFSIVLKNKKPSAMVPTKSAT